MKEIKYQQKYVHQLVSGTGTSICHIRPLKNACKIP